MKKFFFCPGLCAKHIEITSTGRDSLHPDDKTTTDTDTKVLTTASGIS